MVNRPRFGPCWVVAKSARAFFGGDPQVPAARRLYLIKPFADDKLINYRYSTMEVEPYRSDVDAIADALRVDGFVIRLDESDLDLAWSGGPP